mmetsp:Transcript_113134/g.365492  ORF Transcript_113134/g.365492 Transcript_113134/m.365492 type:complete len:213 (-) Transcript_113134:311-949(-)
MCPPTSARQLRGWLSRGTASKRLPSSCMDRSTRRRPRSSGSRSTASKAWVARSGARWSLPCGRPRISPAATWPSSHPSTGPRSLRGTTSVTAGPSGWCVTRTTGWCPNSASRPRAGAGRRGMRGGAPSPNGRAHWSGRGPPTRATTATVTSTLGSKRSCGASKPGTISAATATCSRRQNTSSTRMASPCLSTHGPSRSPSTWKWSATATPSA